MPGAADDDKKDDDKKKDPPAGDDDEVDPPADDDKEDKKDDEENKDKGKKGKVDLSKLDPEVQKLIKDLRTENAANRKKATSALEKNGKLMKSLIEAGVLEDPEADPEEKIKNLTGRSNALEMNNAILAAAIEHGVSKDGLEYFQFLVEKRLGALKDDEELSDDELAEIAEKATKAQGGKGAKSTSVGGKDKTNPPPGDDKNAVTTAAFVAMNMGERSELYRKQPEVYNRCFADAKAKNLL